MLKNYLLVALRSLNRNRLYSLLNILGFSIGIAVFLTIAVYVQDDLSFDRFHSKADRIYRIYTIDNARGVSSSHVGITNLALAFALRDADPAVEKLTVLFSTGNNITLRAGEHTAVAHRYWHATGDFFNIFDFKVLEGDPTEAFQKPGAAFISPEIANSLWPEGDYMGRSFEYPGSQVDMFVAGIIEPAPSNSHLQFDMLIRAEDHPFYQQATTSFGGLYALGYALLREDADVAAVGAHLDSLAAQNNFPSIWDPEIQPLTDLHLHTSHMLYDTNYRKSDIGQLYVLGVIGALVLIIAAFNFMNLSTARSAQRAREVGMRKVVGASRGNMLIQFLGESLIQTFLATAIAVLLFELASPALSNLAGRPLELHLLGNPWTIPGLVAIALVVGLLSGLYPATVLAGFKPLEVLKGNFQSSTRGILLRRVLVISQFTASIALIAATIVAGQQINFIRTMDPGYNREQVLFIDAAGPQFNATRGSMIEEIRNLASVVSVGNSGSVPGQGYSRTNVLPPDAQTQEDGWIMSVDNFDPYFLETLQIELAAGRNFDPARGTDSSNSLIVNEAVARQLGISAEEAVGTQLNLGSVDEPQMFDIVGVVKDFNFATVRHEIEPVIFGMQVNSSPSITIRIQPGAIENTLSAIEAIWENYYPDEPINYSFLDQQFEQSYRGDINFSAVVRLFSLLAIIIACLGLFGLASFVAEQRRREIAVRKVLGANESGIMVLLTTDFVKWVLIANVVGWPIAYYAMKAWLAGFVYHVQLTLFPFLAAGLGALLIAVATVSWQAWRAALTNPAVVLRTE